MSEEERMAAILKWTADKNKHTKKRQWVGLKRRIGIGESATSTVSLSQRCN
jgi:hypothetical protein